MFSPVQAVAASALVLAIGGVWLIAQPFERAGGSLPGAEAQVGVPTWVTGSMEHVENSCSETGSSADGGVSRHSYECTFAWTSSDPRLTGDASRPWTEDTYQTDEGPISVGMDVSFLRNEGGDWTCSFGYVVKGTDPLSQEILTDSTTYTCVGGGGYEGLSAVLVGKPIADSVSDEFVGLIFPGGMPPVPEPPAVEWSFQRRSPLRDPGSLGPCAEGPAFHPLRRRLPAPGRRCPRPCVQAGGQRWRSPSQASQLAHGRPAAQAVARRRR
jgi:hypothetical protein